MNNMKKRLKIEKNLIDMINLIYNFYQRVQKGFLNIAKKKKKNYQIIDSNLDIDLNKKIIINKIESLIK